jgi:lipopolysaccharide/colanic/teichoic acid biosynthesis glycosyltransferase
MFLMKLLDAGRNWLRSPPAGIRNNLLPPERMRRVLELERARADRTETPFAVVAFGLHGRERTDGCWERLARVLKARLRFTDEVGWLEEDSLGAVLAGTGADGARKVVHDVREKLAAYLATLTCTIRVYPAEDARPSGDPGQGRANGHAVPPTRTAAIGPLFERSMPAWKRALDVTGALVGLVLLAPMFAAIALAIKLTSPGPVFFRQWRNGRGGKPFLMWKFRTMIVDAEARKRELVALNEQDEVAFKIKNDPRVTRLGRLLRTTSLDELPQLWNVLRGDMSLVGPRPMVCAETACCTRWQRQRLDVTPGLTCLWQVHGRCRVSFADWMRMDLRYIRSRSLWQDLKLLLLTVPAVLFRRGAH